MAHASPRGPHCYSSTCYCYSLVQPWMSQEAVLVRVSQDASQVGEYYFDGKLWGVHQVIIRAEHLHVAGICSCKEKIAGCLLSLHLTLQGKPFIAHSATCGHSSMGQAESQQSHVGGRYLWRYMQGSGQA